MAVSVSINTISSYTDKHYVRKLIDNFFLSSALWTKLGESAQSFDGGTDIRVPVQHSANSSARRWGGRDETLDTTFQEHATLAVYAIRYYAVSMVLPETDILQNAGKSKILDMLEAQAKLAERSLKDKMGQDIFLDGGVADSSGRYGLDGLNAALTFNGNPSGGAYGGITRASSSGTKNNPTGNAFWNANVIAANANTTYNFWKTGVTMDNSTVLTTAKMQAMYGACSRADQRPELINTSQLIFDKYHGLLTTTLRQMTDDSLGKYGFDHLMYNGTPVVVDDNIDSSGKMQFLNFKHLFLKVHDGMNFKATPFRQPPNQLVNLKFITWMGNLVSDCPNTLGMLTGLTAA